jgi:hypothetical protein
MTVQEAVYVDMSNVVLPFSVGDMLGTGVNFLFMYGEWILLALGVIFSPVLYRLAMKLVDIKYDNGSRLQESLRDFRESQGKKK